MKADEVNLLFTSSGRRMALIRMFKEAYCRHGIRGRIITADLRGDAPTAYAGDRHALVPRVTDPSYVDALLAICREERISLVIPLIDTELELLAENRERFERQGVRLLLSGAELCELAADKMKTYAYFTQMGIPTPRVYTDDELVSGQYEFPLLIKPRCGSSSQGVTKIRGERELAFFRDYVPDAMVQEFVTGEEYTIDVMVDYDGSVKTSVPRLRLETRAGEVSKGMTVKNMDLIHAAEAVVRLLPEPAGCITLQCFRKSDGGIVFIEINPRFGGGIPLSIQAGADFPIWTVALALGERLGGEPEYGWQDGLTMLRYDEAVFTQVAAHAH